MRLSLGWLCAAVLFLQTRTQAHPQNLLREREAAVSIPECSASCLATLVPQYCGSFANTTCICTSESFTAAVTPCALAACNITDGLLLERYLAVTCEVPNNKKHYRQLWLLMYFLPPITFIFVVARIYTRIKLDIGLGPDDWIIMAAFAIFMVCIGGVISTLRGNFGEHTFWLSTEQVTNGLKWFYIEELTYTFVMTLTKLSLLLFFRRIFPNKDFQNKVSIVSTFTVVSSFSLLMAFALQCTPTHGAWTNWTYKVAPVKCIQSFRVAYASAGIGILLDLIIMVLPLPLLWKLNLTWSKKLNLLVMFSLGFFVVLCSSLRLPTLVKLNNSDDPSWDQAPIILWTILEEGIGIICACLPACRSLIGHLFPGMKMTLNSTNGNKNNTSRIYGSSKRFKPDNDSGGFFELERTSENGCDFEGTAERGSIKTEDSETPIHGRFVPISGNSFSHEVKASPRNLQDVSKDGDHGSGIVLTKTVMISSRMKGEH